MHFDPTAALPHAPSTSENLHTITQERDRYFQELFAESRQSYAYILQCRRLQFELENVYATRSWRYTAPLRRLGQWLSRFRTKI